jgi:hypothetical protein
MDRLLNHLIGVQEDRRRDGEAEGGRAPNPKGLASEGGWRRGRTPIASVNLNECLKLRHALTPSRHRGPAPTGLTGRTGLQDGWHGDAQAAIRHPQVERRA